LCVYGTCATGCSETANCSMSQDCTISDVPFEGAVRVCMGTARRCNQPEILVGGRCANHDACADAADCPADHPICTRVSPGGLCTRAP